MKINYFKNMGFWAELSKYNDYLLGLGGKDDYSKAYDARLMKRELPSAKSYPFPDPNVVNDTRYCLALPSVYYMMLFLISKLYEPKKNPLIENVSGYDGRFEYYLSKFGFNNFNIIDDFKYPTEDITRRTLAGIPFDLNNFFTEPTIVINGARFDRTRDIALRWTYSMELVMGYTHEFYDGQYFIERASRWGFKPLCRDFNDLAVAFCREDKYEEFVKKIKEYAI